MEIRNYQKQGLNPNPHGVKSSKIYDTKNALIMHLELQPGQSLKPHITPVDVAFYVLSGNPHILVGEEKIQVQPDDLIESPQDIVHSIYNESNEVARVLVMKLPKPTTATKILK
jgi:quercetin dioxygenase-like cupin family protein